MIVSGMLKSFRSKKTKDADNIFAEALIKNAKENWCDTHVEMLERLIKSTLNGTKYDETLMDENLEDEGLLLRLPCKIGDCVYKFITQHDTFDDQPYKIISAVRFDISMMDEIGKTVFLTREEAEEKLEEVNPELSSDWEEKTESEKNNMDIYNDIENVLRNMTAGRSYRTWSESTIEKICPFVKQIIEDDLLNQKENGEIIGQLIVDEDMIITAMMMALYDDE